jgi:hypothetical protein
MEAKEFVRGDVGQDGKVFWSYRSDVKSGQYWVTPETFAKKKKLMLSAWSRYAKTEKGIANTRKKEATEKRINSKKRLRQTEVYKQKDKKYRSTDRAKAMRVENDKRFSKTPHRAAYHREWKRTKRESDHLYRLREIMRSRLYAATKMKGWGKCGRASENLGCSFEVLMSHLAKQFKPGMTWENHGEWEIDHITPLALATTKDELMRLCHHSNLQPLWKSENRIKWCKTN